MSTQIAEDNFYHIQQLPYVKQLMKENAKLKRRTKELKRLVKLISNNLPLFGDKKRQSADDEVVIIEKKKVKVEVIDVDEDMSVGVGPDISVKVKKETDNIVLVVEEEEALEEEAVDKEEEEAEDEAEEEEAVEEEEAEEEDSTECATSAPAEEEEEVYEVCIKGKTYYTSNEKSGVIYGIDSNGDVSLEVGVYKDGKPIFN